MADLGRKACVVLSVHPYDDGRVFFKEIRSTLAAGYSVDLVSAKAPGAEPFDFYGAKVIPVRGSYGRLGLPLSWWPLFRAAVATEADLYHIHDPDLLLVAWMLKVWTGRPVIHDIHEGNAQGFLVKAYLPRPLRWIAFCVMWMWETVFSRLIGNVVVVEPNNERRFLGLGCRTCRVENFAMREQFPDEPGDPMDRPPSVLFVGTLSKERGCLMIPEIADHLRRFRPGADIIVTDRWFDEDVRKRMGERIAELEVEDVVRFVPNVTLDKLPEYFREARLGLSLVEVTPVSLFQNFTKLFEYMAGGLPIVANDHPNKRPYFEIADAGVLVPYDAEAIAMAIAELMDDPVRLRAYAANGREGFLRHFNWEAAADSMMRFYAGLLDRKGA